MDFCGAVKCSWQAEKQRASVLCCSKLCPISWLTLFLIICLVIASWMRALASGRDSCIHIGKVRRNYCCTLRWSWELKYRSILIHNELSSIEKEFTNLWKKVGFFLDFFSHCLGYKLIWESMSPVTFFAL